MYALPLLCFVTTPNKVVRVCIVYSQTPVVGFVAVELVEPAGAALPGFAQNRCGHYRRQFLGATGDVAWWKCHDQHAWWPERTAARAVRGGKGLLVPVRVCLRRVYFLAT